MVSLSSLLLPILLSAAAVLFASFLMWMVLPHHRSDFKGLPDEDFIVDAMREKGLAAGQYVFPYCADPQQLKDPEYVKRYERGPAGMMIVRPTGPVGMGRSLVLSFGFNLIVSSVTAYVATIGLDAQSAGVDVFRTTATVAFMSYSSAIAWSAIWWGRTWSSVGKEMLDGLVYGLATGALFLQFWPSV